MPQFEYVLFLNNIFPYRFFITCSSRRSIASIVEEAIMFSTIPTKRHATAFPPISSELEDVGKGGQFAIYLRKKGKTVIRDISLFHPQ